MNRVFRSATGGPSSVVLLVALAACGGTNAVDTAGTITTPTASAAPNNRAAHVCEPKPLPYPPPQPALSFAVDGKPDRTFVLGPQGVAIHLAMTQRPGAEVSRLQFAIMPQYGAMPGSEIRVFAPVAQKWAPGRHTTTLRWDGRDEHGRAAKPGTYRIEARVTGVVPQSVTCKDGSHGVELHKGTTDIGLPISVRVTKRA
jgi:hypothetical protein